MEHLASKFHKTKLEYASIYTKRQGSTWDLGEQCRPYLATIAGEKKTQMLARHE